MGETKGKSKPTIRVSQETLDALKQVAEEKETTVTEVAEQMFAAALLKTAIGVPEASSESALSEKTLDKLKIWAEAYDMNITEAAERLITVGINRLGALSKYGVKQKKNGDV